MTLAVLGFAVTAITWVGYLALIPRERVPARPVAFLVGSFLGIAAAVFGVLLDPSETAISFAAIAVILGAYFLWLATQYTLPSPSETVRVGDRLPVLQLMNSQGDSVSSSDWSGRVLLKVFRGHW